ncbi:unnamed protein product [Sphenostylis stenocarpa]|uniref:Uncharacterized protein n=1 Tax=Sphenostylis stenocarpa TaxID=92480 RepID=A0AA86VCT5_9FABA|nr:unnamed protein product [Sphenostylis stenocarpa]
MDFPEMELKDGNTNAAIRFLSTYPLLNKTKNPGGKGAPQCTVLINEIVRFMTGWAMEKGVGKVHGSLAYACKVRGQTPKVAKQDNKKKPCGRPQ